MSYARGKCLISIRLSKENVASVIEPGPLFILVPFVAYLPLFFSTIEEHFSEFVVTNSGNRARYVP